MEKRSSSNSLAGLSQNNSGMHPDLSVIEDNLPVHSAEVKEILPDHEASYENQYGHVEAKSVLMDDGTRYSLRSCTPKELLNNTAVIAGTAWWTHVDLEHYRKKIRGAMRFGYFVLMIGPPQGFKAEDVSLSKAAHDANRIADLELPMQKVDPMIAIIDGDSRSSMYGFAMALQKYAGKRKVPYADLKAPCGPRKFQLQELPRAAAQIPLELASAKDTLWEYFKNGELHRIVGSLIPDDPSHAYNALRILPGLTSGEAGRLADAVGHDTAMRIVEFYGDYWALQPGYKKKFEGRDNILVTSDPGRHIEGIARSSTRRDSCARLERIRDIRGFDGSFDKINFAQDVLQVNCPRSNSPKLDRLLTLPRLASGRRRPKPQQAAA